MAIDAHIPYPETHSLAHDQSKTFYPVRIPVSHWQLRHFISCPEQDILYYASGHDVYCLNTRTKKRKHIATLPFEARCTASGYGYVCVGGEDEGHFAAIKMEGSGLRNMEMEVDSALPIDDRWRSGPAREEERSREENGVGRRAGSVKVERIGEEIVNSISIHRITDEEVHLDDIVAVLTNNDKTVRVYSLPQNLETTVLDLPFAMNHATISPDGTMLVAVGDFNQAYFFHRELQETPPQIHKPHNRLTSGSVEWTLTSVVNLHIGTPENTTGFFTTAWNESGRLVALGSEGGYITVFDLDLLRHPEYEDDEAIVAVIPSSRPDLAQPHPGAVRSMLFAPDPWDLLVWAEDQGRVCIGDLRTGLKSKQILNLEPKDEGLQRSLYEDVPADESPAASADRVGRDVDELEADFIRRYRAAPDNATAVNFATEYIEARRRQRQHRQSMLGRGEGSARASPLGMSDPMEDDPQGLTAREQQILETLRTTRQREEARANGAPARSVNYTSPDMFGGGSRSGSGTPSRMASPASGTRPISEILSTMNDPFPELARTSAASPGPSTASQRENEAQATALPSIVHPLTEGPWSQRSSSGLVRLSDGSRLPRRRASVILTPPASGGPGTRPSGPPRPSDSQQPSRTSPQPTSNPSAGAPAEEEDNPWRTIEDHMTLARGPLFEGAARAQAASPAPAPGRPSEQELQTELAAERARARSLARQRDRWRSLRADADRGLAADAATVVRLANVGRGDASGYERTYETLLRRSQLRGFTGREVGVRTAGLAISSDGRTLWCATEDGIFEVGMNRKERMFWPGIEPR
ncbi:hypothetical protein D0869_07130 [Hortaea werneckii]|uniref:DUF2415 domain-containing protein n=1 Tax=Hortaea werneckii TaxID=91943 RepID=A0A3M6XK76_HORWE|nr:hypothetical protein D0869_07130 [Hortaea werneckii]RMX90968.1 hypothetical protein D0867_15155 [Hortaea werneckii]RMX97262.1 hypothetical protein D0868_10738 [Hortaea werneckii]RMY33150.1 hypothetical protein D0866_06125 [Hortaea werneckii]